MRPSVPRKRRPAAETRAEILEVARRHLLERGPAEVRLDEIAAEIGVSRQAVLHHFGSREALMRAVVEVAWVGLFRDLGALAAGGALAPERLVDRVDEVARRKGNARLGGWLLLTGEGLPAEVFDGALAGLPEAGDVEVRRRMLLVGAALFGDALFGSRLRQVLGLPDDEVSRADLRALLTEVLSRGSATPPR